MEWKTESQNLVTDGSLANLVAIASMSPALAWCVTWGISFAMVISSGSDAWSSSIECVSVAYDSSKHTLHKLSNSGLALLEQVIPSAHLSKRFLVSLNNNLSTSSLGNCRPESFDLFCLKSVSFWSYFLKLQGSTSSGCRKNCVTVCLSIPFSNLVLIDNNIFLVSVLVHVLRKDQLSST